MGRVEKRGGREGLRTHHNPTDFCRVIPMIRVPEIGWNGACSGGEKRCGVGASIFFFCCGGVGWGGRVVVTKIWWEGAEKKEEKRD